MFKNIRNIHIEKLFAAILQDHLFSFRIGSLPSDVHFTLVFDQKLEDINLHLTRNIAGGSKPQIKILVANRQMLLENSEAFFWCLFKTVLEPFDMQEFAERNDLTVGFLSYSNMESHGSGGMIMDKFKTALEPHAKIRSKRLKISGDLDAPLQAVFGSREIKNVLYEQMKPVSFEYVDLAEGGMLFTETSHHHAIRIGEQWYLLRTDLSVFQLLRTLVNRKTAHSIIANTLDALERIQSANSYEDTRPYNTPCRLELCEITLPVIAKSLT